VSGVCIKMKNLFHGDLLFEIKRDTMPQGGECPRLG
jgi:hypothetical protein